MTLYRRKSIQTFEAVRVPEYDADGDVTEYVEECVAISSWCGGWSYMMHDGIDDRYYLDDPGKDHVLVPTPTGYTKAYPGEWIMKMPDGKFYVTTDELFRELYEEVAE